MMILCASYKYLWVLSRFKIPYGLRSDFTNLEFLAENAESKDLGQFLFLDYHLALLDSQIHRIGCLNDLFFSLWAITEDFISLNYYFCCVSSLFLWIFSASFNLTSFLAGLKEDGVEWDEFMYSARFFAP